MPDLSDIERAAHVADLLNRAERPPAATLADRPGWLTSHTGHDSYSLARAVMFGAARVDPRTVTFVNAYTTLAMTIGRGVGQQTEVGALNCGLPLLTAHAVTRALSAAHDDPQMSTLIRWLADALWPAPDQAAPPSADSVRIAEDINHHVTFFVKLYPSTADMLLPHLLTLARSVGNQVAMYPAIVHRLLRTTLHTPDPAFIPQYVNAAVEELITEAHL